MPNRPLALVTGAAGLAAGLVLGAGQFAVAGHTNPVLTAELDGHQEVVEVEGKRAKRNQGDLNGSGEAYVFGVDGDPGRQTLCYVLQVEKVAETELAPGAPRAAHIHQGADGANGPVVATLAWPQGGDAADCLSVGETRNGTPVFADGFEPADLFADPDAFYINVHNGDFPAGAVRGQLGTHSH